MNSFLQCTIHPVLNFCCLLGVCAATQLFCSVSRNTVKLCSIFTPIYVGVHNIHIFFPRSLVIFLFQDLYTVHLPLPLLLLPLSPADCRIYLIWSFTAPCLTAFQEHFFPALPLAASCSVGTHVNSGIGRKMKSSQDERTELKLHFCLYHSHSFCQLPNEN